MLGFGSELTRVIHWPQYEVVYLRVPKSGNKSIRLAIPGGTQKKVDIRKLSRRFPGCHSFSFVRNPWARLVSTWAAKIRPPGTNTKTIVDGVHDGFRELGLPMRAGMSFEEFAEVACAHDDDETEKHLKSQSHFVVRDGVVVVDFLGRVETMSDDWAKLQACTGIREDVPHHNKNPHGSYTERYDDRLRELVGDRYRQDVEIFGYEFGA